MKLILTTLATSVIIATASTASAGISNFVNLRDVGIGSPTKSTKGIFGGFAKTNQLNARDAAEYGKMKLYSFSKPGKLNLSSGTGSDTR